MPTPAQIAKTTAEIVGMANRLMLRCRNLNIDFAASVVYATWKDICVKTDAWRLTETKDITAVGQTDFVLTPAFDGNVRRITKVLYLNRPLTQGVEYTFDGTLTVTTISPATVVQTSGVAITYAFDPIVDDPSGVDPDIFSQWDNPIFNGAMADLLDMSNQPWFDKTGKQQEKHEREYRKQWGTIKLDAERPGGKTNGPMIMNCRYPFA